MIVVCRWFDWFVVRWDLGLLFDLLVGFSLVLGFGIWWFVRYWFGLLSLMVVLYWLFAVSMADCLLCSCLGNSVGSAFT